MNFFNIKNCYWHYNKQRKYLASTADPIVDVIVLKYFAYQISKTGLDCMGSI